MKKIKTTIIGYGDRGKRYSDYALKVPLELEVVAVVDINPLKLKQAKERFTLKDEYCFLNIQDFLKSNIECEIVINCTMDNQHYSTSKILLEKGYNILLEKPVTSDPKQFLDLIDKSRKNKCKIIICHVLRYTNFYSNIKKIIDSGKIGTIMSMELNEHVWYGHFVNAYVRGKWKSEQECGSGMLLAKCCHDTDLMCWINNITVPKKVSSFGSKSLFTDKNAPSSATDFCYKCPIKDSCMFDAYKFELKSDFIPFYTWAGINKPIETITDSEKEDFLKHDDFGRCVYKSGMDIVDRQCVSVEYENGSIATLNMIGGTNKGGRKIHIICTMGEIEGNVEDNNFTLRVFNKNDYTYSEEIINCESVTADKKDNAVAGHYGGDYYLMRDLVRYLNNEKVSNAMTVIEDSINGHFLVYAAEESRKTSSIIDFNRFKKEKSKI